MKVFVIGLNDRGLAPTTSRKARILVRDRKAVVVRKTPYTIRLLYRTGVAGGPMTLGIDTGSQHIGVAVAANDRAVSLSEYALRSSMEKRSLNVTRREYRRGRRYRKVRYRKPKFRPHTKRHYSDKPVKRNKHMTHWVKETNTFGTNRKKGWLPPSIQSKVDHHVRIIRRHLEALPDNTELRLELGRFDIAHMKDPSVRGAMYQKGRMYEYENLKAYVFSREGYKCRVCGAKAGTKRQNGTTVRLILHHIDFRSKGATDNPDRMTCVCDRCHNARNHAKGGILYRWMIEEKKFRRGYRDATFMNILGDRLRNEFPRADITYGNITAADRKQMGLPKTHAYDALAIATAGRKVVLSEETVHCQQVRSGKRSLHEANPRKGRKEPNRTAKRNSKNTKRVTIGKGAARRTFCVYDRVRYGDKTGWISGFTGNSAYVKDAHDDYISVPGKTYKQVPLSGLRILSRNNNWLIGAYAPIGR